MEDMMNWKPNDEILITKKQIGEFIGWTDGIKVRRNVGQKYSDKWKKCLIKIYELEEV